MSDRLDEISKKYKKNVEESRSIGLFPIPEYPELEVGGMWSAVLETVLTTLRFLAPATLLTVFWTHHHFFYDILKYIDSAFRTVIFSNEDKKQEVIQWLTEAGSVRVEDLETVWRHGWIVCGVLDAALPGACAGHPPTRLSLKHAQSIADHYLGVEPIFTRQELETNDVLSKHEEWKLIKFLDKVRIAISKLTPPPTTPKIKENVTPTSTATFTLDYIARGSGLTAAQVNNKMFFKIYPTAQQSLDPGDITIVIKGPKNIYGVSNVSPILGKAQMIRQTLLGLQSKQSNYTENILPVTQGTTYLRSYGKNDMKKTYYIPKAKYDIDIEIEKKSDHVKVGYTVPSEGQYEITITSRGENIVGSPYFVKASKNIVGILEKESFSLEDGEEIDIVDVKTDRKVVLRIVDFVTEKMILKENGTLEKISEDEARKLMELDQVDSSDEKQYICNQSEIRNRNYNSSNTFYSVAKRVLNMNRVCSALRSFEKNKQNILKDNETLSPVKRGSKGRVPDIINSTFEKNASKSYEREKIIVPENISVSLLMDKPLKELSMSTSNCLENSNNLFEEKERFKLLEDPFEEDDTISISTAQSVNNPFLNDMFDTSYTEKEFGSYILSEYETNNSQNEESHTFGNPFIELTNKNDKNLSQFGSLNSNTDENSIETDISRSTNDVVERIEIIENEYNNPFITKCDPDSEKTPVTDFIIGAPVSLPSVLGISLSESNISSTPENTGNSIYSKNYNCKRDNENLSFISSQESLDQRDDAPAISPFHSLGSDTYNFLSQGSLQRSRNISPKELWDSAYVSIDDSASSSDNTYNHSDRSASETLIRNSYSINNDYFSNESSKVDNWASSEHKDDSFIHDDLKGLKWEFKRQVFTPILEENEKSITFSTKENTEDKTDSVSRAFSDLNGIYDDIFTQPEESLSTINEDSSTRQNLEVEYITENSEIRVDSASEELSDVKRHAGEIEGSISEVQANDTESVSASRNLNNNAIQIDLQRKSEKIQFGDTAYTNIVLEKKRYWDEKIRLIEAKNLEETKLQQKRKRLASKQFRHNDSISKRKGKQIVKNFLNSGDSQHVTPKPVNRVEENIDNETEKMFPIDMSSNVKLVEKWKTYWDNRLEEENKEHLKTVHVPNVRNTIQPETSYKLETPIVIQEGRKTDNPELKMNPSPNKQELPEEVFKAFETCPKRFFGTSRKHILSKIDSFLGKDKRENLPRTENSIQHETGLVSSRISMFHHISNTEPLPGKSRHRILRTENQRDICLKTENLNDINYCDKNKNAEDICSSNPSQHEQTESRSGINNECNNKKVCGDKPSTQFTEELPITQNPTSQYDKQSEYAKSRNLKTFSKSEMDIFNKIALSVERTDEFDKHKSVEELPKINVRSFIDLYEDVSKSTQSKIALDDSKTYAKRKYLYYSSSSPATPSKSQSYHLASKHLMTEGNNKEQEQAILNEPYHDDDKLSNCTQSDRESLATDKKYLSLSDIELEIIDKKSDTSEPCLENQANEVAHNDYKSRFKMAKQYFQSLEELREMKGDRKLSECKITLNDESVESLENIGDRPKRKRTRKTKSNSMPSSEIAKIWDQMQKKEDEKDKKLVKISEKFNVEDLFEDVMEGRLSRQGSLRGIPHKKAVLEAFKSMENLSDSKLNSYEMAVSPTNELSQTNQAKQAQTYLSEYPYLPTTDPSKFQPRFDANASGLISYNELLKSKPRRNSVPDIRLNPSFTENL